MNNHPTGAKSLTDSWLTIKLLAQAEPAFTQSALRYLVFNAACRQSSNGSIPGNGLAPHIRRVGAKVLINHGGFLSWIDGSALSPADQLHDGTISRGKDKKTNIEMVDVGTHAPGAEITGSAKRKGKNGPFIRAGLRGAP